MEDIRFNGVDRRAFGLGLIGFSGAAAAGSAFAQPAPKLPAIPDIPAAKAETVGMSTDGLAKIHTMIQGHVDAGRIQGAVTAVARRNKLVHFQAHGYQDPIAKTPMREDAMFIMMSSTKPVTGVAILQLIEQAKVHLDDPISKYVPELGQMRVRVGPRPRAAASATASGETPAARAPDRAPVQTVPQAREITIKDLCTHTSGLNDSVPRRQGDTLATFIPRLKDVILDYQPGTNWEYSATSGPDILARVVEVVSGTTYDQYLKKNIFGPAGMKDATHNMNADQAARLVRRGEYRNGAWGLARGADRTPAPTTYFAGAFGLQATARDYLQFETMLLNQGRIHGKRVLTPTGVELMRANIIGDLYDGIGGNTKGTGFGILVRTVLDPKTCDCNRDVGAFGWGGAYGTMTWTDPKRELVAVLMIQQSVAQVQRDFERVVREAMIA